MVVLVFAFTGILWACYPLLTIPVYSGDAKIWVHNTSETSGQDRPRWADKLPVGFIQQIIIKVRSQNHIKSRNNHLLKAAVHPYSDQHVRSDAFRGPLAIAFKMNLSDIAEYFDR